MAWLVRISNVIWPMVYPSCFALFRYDHPTAQFPPTILTGAMGWPKFFSANFAIIRAAISLGPPGVHVMTISIDFDGNSADHADHGNTTKRAKVLRRDNTFSHLCRRMAFTPCALFRTESFGEGRHAEREASWRVINVSPIL